MLYLYDKQLNKKTIKKFLIFTISFGLLLVSCDKEADDVHLRNDKEVNVNNKSNSKNIGNNLKSNYPILINDDLSDTTVLRRVISNLDTNEYIHSYLDNGVVKHEIRYNPSGVVIPNDPNAQLSVSCNLPNAGATCLALISAAHQYNLDHCEGSDILWWPGTLAVVGWGCEDDENTA